MGQHLPSGLMVMEQVNAGQMTGSQITVRFYREKAHKDLTRTGILHNLLFKCFDILLK